ncbi:MAG: hypothetical protein U0174_19570 [Polyangiaceae bacterium]
MRRSIAAALLFASLALACAKGVPAEFHGVKLGMQPGDVRARFDLPSGHWKNDGGTSTVGGGALKLTWKRDAGGDGPEEAVFEFHNGLLVAIRARYAVGTHDAFAMGTSRLETSSTVLARDDEGGKKNVRWIAKDCPDHEAEVRSILGK